MKVIIAGSRGFDDYEILKDFVNKLNLPKDTEIVSGHAYGADRLGERYAIEKGYKVKVFPAEWHKYGKSAGYRRNREMAKYADTLIAFWDGKSKGTRHMIELAIENNLKYYVCYYP